MKDVVSHDPNYGQDDILFQAHVTQDVSHFKGNDTIGSLVSLSFEKYKGVFYIS